MEGLVRRFHVSRFAFHIFATHVLLAMLCLWTQAAIAIETQQLYDKAILYKEMYRTTLEVGRDYCLSRGDDEAGSRYFGLYLGTLYYEMGEWENAIQDLEKFEKLSDLQPEDKILSRIRRGMALYQRGKKSQAKRIWQREIRRNKKNPKIQSAIGYAYARSDFQLNKALTLCQTSFQEALDNHFIKRNLGWVYFKQGDIQKAREILESIDLRTPDFLEKKEDRAYEFYDAAILLHLSQLYLPTSGINPTYTLLKLMS